MKTLAIAMATAAMTLLFGQVANAGTGGWTVDGPEGGPVYQLLQNRATSTIYAEVGWGGNTIFKSDDAGVTWSAFARTDWSGVTYDFALAQTSTPELVSLASGAYIYDSTGPIFDLMYGSTGTNVSNPYTVSMSADGQTIYIGGRYDGVAVSADGGHSFAIMSSGLPTTSSGYALINQVVVDPETPTTAYVVVWGTNVYRTTDGGNSWSAFGTGLPSGFTGTVYVDPVNPTTVFAFNADNHIYRSTSGSNWASVATTTNLIATMTAVPGAANTLYAFGWFGLLYKSTDGGASWTSLGQSFPSTRFPVSMLATGGSASALVVGTYNGLWRSTDEGISWTRANSGYDATFVHGISQSAADPTQFVVSTEKMGVFYSTDGGKTYSASSGTEDSTAEAVVRSPVDPSIVFAAVEGVVNKSTDGGKTFSAINLKANAAIAVDPTNPDYILGGTSANGVTVTTDGGTSWSSSNGGLSGDEDVRAIIMDPRDPSTVYLATYNHGLFKSSDEGASWAAMGPSGLSATVMTINPNNPNQIYVGTFNNGLYRSDDAGATWTKLDFNFGGNIGPWLEALAFDPDNKHVMYASGVIGPYRTVDDGATWQQLAWDTLPYRGSDITDTITLDAADHSRILLSDRYTGLLEYTTSVDLSVTGSVTASVAPGDTGSMAFSITNQSDLDSADVQVSINVNSSLTVSNLQSTAGSCSISSSVISCDLGALAGKASQGVSFSVSAQDVGSYDATASATPYEYELAASDNQSTLSLDVQAPTSSGGGGSGTGGSGTGTSGGSGGSGGGGGAFGLWMLLGLFGLALRRRS